MTERAGRRVVLGIDAGGTHTRGAAVGDDGAVLARSVRAAANPRTVGDAVGRGQVAGVVDELRAAAPGRVVHVVLGSAGLVDPAPPHVNEAWARTLQVPRVTVDSDARIAHAAAFGAGPGVVVVAGTGSQCLALGAGGERVRVGGWGPSFGDEGSAHWIARTAIGRALRALDEDRPDAFTAALLAFAEVDPDLPHAQRNVRLLDVLYAPAAGAASHARFATCVAELARSGEPAAAAILRRAGASLAELAALAARRSELRAVAHAGSVLDRNPFVRAAFETELSERGLTVVRRAIEPVLGAAYLAMKAVGWEADMAARLWAGFGAEGPLPGA